NLFLFFIVAFIYYLNPYGLNNYLNRIFVRSPAPGYANFELLQLDTLTNLLVYIKNIFIVEPIFSIIFIFGSILLWKKNKKQFYFLVPWVIIYLLLLSALTGSMIRYALPVVPILIIVNAYFAYFIFSKTKKRVLGKTVLIFVISAYTLIFSILFDLRLTQIDTRVLARDWVLGNVPSGSVIKNFNLADELNLNENKENIKMIKENLPELFSTKRKYMLDLSADDYPKPSYFVVNYEQLEDLSPKFEYVIISSQERSFLYSETEKLEDNYVLVKYFYPTEDSAMQYGREYLGIPFNHSHFNPLALFKQFDYNGPFVEIYKLKNEGNQKQ
ncbi:hypothetical protein KJ641_03565, partial [Patescibacteria group bacterium]|nr:hypothetical protein [Patescibacteria group bacterium]